ncbi:MAG: DNA internalization-related competence protein ComEC/Rec2 [Desulfamplus sp.]|nr:DNA internalization-related competence protein ComEC/Rec2 [Desulfamplus sp.]
MKILLKYQIPPLIPLFISICIGITAFNYIPIFGEKSFSDLFFSPPQNHISHFADKGAFNITAIITSEPEEFENQYGKFDKRIRFNILVKSINGQNIKPEAKQIKGLVQMSIYNPLLDYKNGDIVQFNAKINALRNFNNPGGFDYVKYMQKQDLWGRINVNGKDVTIISNINTLASNSYNLSNLLGIAINNFKISIKRLRDNFVSHIFKNIEDQDSAAILCALIVGNKDFISKELRGDFAKTGASHILAISGLHLSIVATLFFYLLNFLLSCSKWILIQGWSKKGAAILTIFPILIYALLSGFSEATKRAVIMVTIFMVAAVVERESNTFNSLAAAGILILLFEPLSLFTVSFQLSFGAVFFILMGLSLSAQYKPVINKMLNSRFKGRFAERLKLLFQSPIFKTFVSFIFISFCATLGTQILVMHYFNISSFSGLLTNLILIPSVGFAVLPLGLTALFCYLISPLLSESLLKFAELILNPSVAIIKSIAQLPFSYIQTFTPNLIEIGCYYLFFISLFVAVKSLKIGEKGVEKGVVSKKIFAIGLSVALICFLTALIYEYSEIKGRFFNKNLSITVLDVGQGSAALIKMPMGKTILVDGGGFSYSSKFDTGESIIAPMLWQQKIMSLDAVVLTHPDADHLNGLVYIIEHFKVKRLIKNCDARDSTHYHNLIAQAKRSGVELFIVDDNTKPIKMGRSGEIHFFHPLKPCSHNLISSQTSYKKEVEESEDFNNNSIVFKLIFNQTSILFTGDIMAQTESNIAYKYGKNLQSDILIAPHHGSSTSSSNIFLDNVAPKFVVISCGWQNRFGFPRDVVINRYNKREIKIFRTDLNGAITLDSDGVEWNVASFLNLP